MKAMNVLDESAETPKMETPEDTGDGIEGQIMDAIQEVPCCANLSPEELSQVVSAVMGVVNGGGDGLDDMESFTKKTPHPLGKEFE